MLSLTVASLAVWTSTGPCEVVGTCVHSSGYPLNYGAKESCTINMDPPGAITSSAFVSLLPDHYGEVAKSRAVELPDSTRSACRTLRNQGDNPSLARCELKAVKP